MQAKLHNQGGYLAFLHTNFFWGGIDLKQYVDQQAPHAVCNVATAASVNSQKPCFNNDMRTGKRHISATL